MRQRGWLLILGAICAIGPLSIDMYLPGAPDMAREFGAGGQSIQLSVVSYLLGLIVGQLMYGPLSDHIGRKPPLYIGLTLYAIASVACLLAYSAPIFVFLRFFQGLGGCAGMVIARAVIRDKTAAIGTARALSLLMLVVSAAPLLAPLLGAALLSFWGWRAMFGTMALFGLFCLALIRFAMQETLLPENRVAITWAKALNGYLVVLRDCKFMVYTICNGLVQGGMYAYIAGSSYILIDQYKMTPQQYGLVFAINSLGMIIASQINVYLVDRFELDNILSKTLIFLGGLGLLGLMVPEEIPISVLLPGFFFFLTCIGFVGPNAAAISLSEQAKHAGTASALMGTLIFVIGAICGIAVTILHDGTVRPLIIIMAICGISAALLHRFMLTMVLRPNES